MVKKYIAKKDRKNQKIKRDNFPKQKFRFSKSLTRSIMPFTRERETVVRLDTRSGIDNGAGTFIDMIRTNDGGLVGRIRVRLSNLNNSTDFTNLFKEYKLNYIKMTFIPAGNVAGTRTDLRDPATMNGNKNILIRTMLNRTNEVPTDLNTVNDWAQVQAKKQWVLVQDKPTTITCKLNQLSVVQSGDAASYATNTMQTPQYISTNSPSVNHYGLTVRFDSIDGTAITEANGDLWPRFRLITKVYFTCRGVA
jgi:hypothetical protein